MIDIKKLGITEEQFKQRFAICQHYRISQNDFFKKSLYLIDEKVLYARIVFSKSIDLNLLSANSEDYHKITGLSDNLLTDLFVYSNLLKDYFLDYFSFLYTDIYEILNNSSNNELE